PSLWLRQDSRPWQANVIWQIGQRHLVGVCHPRGLLDHVLKIADVARPAVSFERFEGVAGETLSLASSTDGPLNQRTDVLSVLAQRWDMKVNNLDAIEKVFSKMPARNSF